MYPPLSTMNPLPTDWVGRRDWRRKNSRMSSGLVGAVLRAAGSGVFPFVSMLTTAGSTFFATSANDSESCAAEFGGWAIAVPPKARAAAKNSTRSEFGRVGHLIDISAFPPCKYLEDSGPLLCSESIPNRALRDIYICSPRPLRREKHLHHPFRL